jgi:hypothetical protein
MAAGFLLLFFQSGARYSFGIVFKAMMAEMGDFYFNCGAGSRLYVQRTG